MIKILFLLCAMTLLVYLDLFDQTMADDEGITKSPYGKYQVEDERDDLYSKTVEVPFKNGVTTFEIHIKEENIGYANRVAEILKKDAPAILEYFDYKPTTNIHMTVDDGQTGANGSATVVPRNIINFYTFPPTGTSTLLSGDDFIRLLVLHELVHVVHHDQTRGVNQILRSIFGSVGKYMPFITPRWFSEGIATWAETKFTEGGRLRFKQVRYELDRALSDPTYCRDIACIDDPGIYPGLSSAYHLGADFLSYVEEKKEGTIRCLIQENSDNFPFFLNGVFEDCTGRNGEVWFLEYRQRRAQEISERKERIRSKSFVKKMQALELDGKGDAVLPLDVVVSNGKLIYVHKEEDKEQIKFLDLEKGTMTSRRPVEKVWQLMTPSPASEDKNEVLISSTETSSHLFYSKRRNVTALNLTTNESKKIFGREHGAEYPFRVNENRIVFLKWKANAWQLWMYHEDSQKSFLVYEFSKWLQLQQPRAFSLGKEVWLSFKVFDHSSTKPHQMWAYSLARPGENSHPVKIYQSTHAFEYFDQCDGSHLIYDQSGRLNIVAVTTLGQSIVKTLKVDWPEEVALLRWDDSNSVVFLKDDPNRAYLLKRGCQDVVRELTREVHGRNINTAENIEDNKKPKHISPDGLEPYPDAHHFLPHWWFVSFNLFGDSARYYGINTSLNDPKDIHVLDLGVKRYDKLDVTSPKIRYFYNFYGDLVLNLDQYTEYTRSQARTSNDKYERKSVALSTEWKPGNATWAPSLRYGEFKEIDIISDRKHKTLLFNNSLIWSRNQGDDFLQIFSTKINVRKQETVKEEDFWGAETRLDTSLAPFDKFFTHMKFSYGKYFKDRLSGGVIFGGGGSDIFDGYLHDFYGLFTKDAFGNEIMTGRLQFDYEVEKIHTGSGFIPIYMRKVNFIAGGGYLKTDYIFSEKDNRFLKDSDVMSLHAGVRFKMILFYRGFINFDFVYAQLYHKKGQDTGVFLPILTATIFP